MIGNPLRRPYGSHFALSRSDDLQVPDFTGIRDGKTFSAVIVSVFFGDFIRDPNGMTGGSGPFRHDAV